MNEVVDGESGDGESMESEFAIAGSQVDWLSEQLSNDARRI